jgi:hypothetical protein
MLEKNTANVGANDSSYKGFSEACGKDCFADDSLGGTEFCKQVSGKCMLGTKLITNFQTSLSSGHCFSHSTVHCHLYL